MPGYRLQVEMDDEPAYIFGPEQGEDAEPLITIAPGNAELARDIRDWLNADKPGKIADTPEEVDALTRVSEEFKQFPDLANAIIARRDDRCEDTASALRCAAQDHQNDGRITEEQMWDLIGLSELD